MAFFKGSAYEFTALFEPSAAGVAMFRGLRARRQRRPEPVLEHTVALKNRLDSVAHEYYAEGRDWRWLVEANPEVLFPEDLLWTDAEPAGTDGPPMGTERTGRVLIVPRRAELR